MTGQHVITHFKTVPNAAKSLGVCLKTVYNWKSNGIPYKTQRWIEFETGGALKAAKK